jgi:hypothetical protein
MILSNLRLNWLTVSASGLLVSLLSLTGVQATELSTATANATTSTVAQNNSSTLIARAKKKKPLKKKRVRRKVRTTATVTSTSEVSQAPAPVTPVITEPTAPPAPPEPPTVPVVPPTPAETPKAAEPPQAPEPPKAEGPTPFSITTKLQGEAIFGLTGTLSGDFSRNTALGTRVRLNLFTNIGEKGVLTTRLQATGLGLSTKPIDPAATPRTPEGALSFTDGTNSNSVGIDLLKYEFPLAPQTQVVIIGNAGVADDFTDTINPYFDGDGGSGAISFFGNRPPIYYTVQGAGAGVRQKLGDNAELSLGFLGRTANNPAAGNGLFGGGYGAIAQLTFKTGENSKIGVTYTRSLNSDPGTGSTNANLGGASNNYGLQGTFRLNPQFALGGWVGYTQNQLAGADRQIWNWAVTASAPDFGGKGNLAGILVGQEPRVASDSSGNADTRAGLHIEGFYQVKISDNFSITPGIIYLTAPDQSANSSGATIGVIRSTFTF